MQLPLPFPSNDDERRNMLEVFVNLPTLKSLDTSYRFVMNKSTRRVHLTANTCDVAVHMKEKRRIYVDHVPPDGKFCSRCERKLLQFREEKLRYNA